MVEFSVLVVAVGFWSRRRSCWEGAHAMACRLRRSDVSSPATRYMAS